MKRGAAFAALFFAMWTSAGAQTGLDVVGTVAGNGTSGNLDGNATAAEFMNPVALAVDRATNTIYVADEAGQRIRAIDAARNVTTLAGSGATLRSGLAAAGGYLDGPAATARFDGPSGIAVGPGGTVYVADAVNRCIRTITNGMVATIAGSPLRQAAQDGPLATASFGEPRSVAVASDGTIYVADFPTGVRVVGKGGISTIAIPAPYADGLTGLSYLEGARPALFGAVRSGVWRYDLTSHAFSILTTSKRHPAAFAPFGAVALDYDSVVASSALFDAIFMGTYPHYRGETDSRSLQIAGFDEKDTNFVGGFADDVPERALFDGPLGLARDAAGNILVADSGNRRIRIVPASVVAAAEP